MIAGEDGVDLRGIPFEVVDAIIEAAGGPYPRFRNGPPFFIAPQRWLKEPDFDAAYRAARRVAFSQAIARLQQASGAAVATLLKIMVDANAPASTRVRAADSVLDHAAKAIEIEDIEVRVTELERSLAAKPARIG